MTEPRDAHINRVTRIVAKAARRRGLMAAVYGSLTTFDVLCQGATGLFWIRRRAVDLHAAPAKVARSICAEIRRAAL